MAVDAASAIAVMVSLLDCDTALLGGDNLRSGIIDLQDMGTVWIQLGTLKPNVHVTFRALPSTRCIHLEKLLGFFWISLYYKIEIIVTENVIRSQCVNPLLTFAG